MASFVEIAADFAAEVAHHAYVGVLDAYQPLFLATAVILSLFASAILIDSRIVLRMFYTSPSPAVPATLAKDVQASASCVPAKQADMNVANPAGAAPRWEWFTAANWLIAFVFCVSFSYCVVSIPSLSSPVLGAPRLMIVVCCLTLAYLLGFFGVGILYRDVESSRGVDGESLAEKLSEEAASTCATHDKGLPACTVEAEDDEAEPMSKPMTKRAATSPRRRHRHRHRTNNSPRRLGSAAAGEKPEREQQPPHYGRGYARRAGAREGGSWKILGVLAFITPFLATLGFAVLTRSGVVVDVPSLVTGVMSLSLDDAACLLLPVTAFFERVNSLEKVLGLIPGTLQTALLVVALYRVTQLLYALARRVLYGGAEEVEDPVAKLLAQPEMRDLSCFPTPFPNGWYKVASSHEISPGVAKYVKCLGEHLVVFRGERSHEVAVLDAYCPHLGANLGVGSRVVDDCVECPFHGWQFTTSGKCKNIPYSSRDPPAQATTRAWEVREYYGAVMIWFDAEGRPPAYELENVPDIDEGRSVYRGNRHIHVKMHIQDFAENSADAAHFNILHGRFYFPVIGPLFRVHHDTTWEVDPEHKHVGIFCDTAHLKLLGRWSVPGTSLLATIRFVGPGGMVLFAFHVPNKGDIMLFKTFTPMEAMVQRVEDVWFADKRIPRWLVSYVVNNFFRAFKDDIFVWEAKAYDQKRPLFVQGDGPIGALRRWYKQFISEHSKPCAQANSPSTAAAALQW